MKLHEVVITVFLCGLIGMALLILVGILENRQ